MKTIIHVNQHVIKRNRASGTREPVLTVKTYKANDYGHSVEVQGPSRIVYRPDKPLSCGAHVWIETEADVVVDGLAPLPAARTHDYEVQGVMTDDEGGMAKCDDSEADVWAVYERPVEPDENGDRLAVWIAEFSRKEDAQFFAHHMQETNE
jgi:hypothetical protein